MLALTEPFIPAADEVEKLEFGTGAASQFYKKIFIDFYISKIFWIRV